MDSPPTSHDSTYQVKLETAVPTAETKQPKKADAITISREESNDSDSEESTLPRLSKEREAHQPATAFFTKPPRKQAIKAKLQARGEEKGKEKMAAIQSKTNSRR